VVRPGSDPIDGKWLRGVADGQVKLFAAMLHEEKVIIAQHRIPDDTNEITQVRELLDPAGLTGAVITADAAHAQRDTAAYIAGERESDCLLTVKGSQPGLQRAIYDKISADCGAAPDHVTMDYGHGRIIRRSLRVTGADGIEFPHAARVLRIRRDTCDTDGTATAKEIVHGITSLDAARGTPEILAGLTRGQWGIESVHWPRHRLGRRCQHRIRRQRPAGHGHPQEHRGHPALPRGDNRDHPHPAIHQPRPQPRPRHPPAMRPTSQTTLPIPCAIGSVRPMLRRS
jgi:DDE family transposase